ncbi:Tetratricopeptide repeat [Lysobacter silvestris]|uniref:Tetratricopeptide repeat n=2 Tax=Solilutibacter silvestris TaxID=1645665 RepID=A0A2K1PXP1_9GAMM|nr:Tetratricopeptide repeat [Lysobacter silvestris]
MVLALALLPALAGPANAATPKGQPSVLAESLAGEFALQEGRLKDAAQHYLAAAKSSHDAVLAERATRIALLADDNARAAEALELWRPSAPDSLVVRMADLTLKLRADDAAAVTTQARALIADRDPRGWKYALVALSGGSKDPKVAAQVLTSLVGANALPDDVQAWLAYAGLAQKLSQPQLSQAMVAETVKRWPADPRVALLHSGQLVDEGRIDEARAVVAQLEPQAAGSAELRLAIAGQYEALGDFAAAERVLAKGPQSTDTIGLRAAMFDRAKDDAGLARLYEFAKRRGGANDPRNRMLLGTLAETLKRYDEALKWYAGVTGEAGDSARLRSANVRYDQGHKDEAYKALQSLQTDPRVIDAVQRDAFLLEGEFRRKDRDDKGEIAAYDRGTAALPDEPGILYARALAWERMDRVDKAEADLRKILVTDPENIAALNALGYTLADRTTRYAEALQLIDRARAADPANAAIIDSYGWVLYRLGKTDEAMPYLRRAYMLQKDPEIATHIGEVLWVQGHRDDARRYFEEARKLDPDSKALQRTLEKLGVKA